MRFATLYTDVYWRRRQVSERDGLFENRTAIIDSLKISSIMLLYYWITMYVIFVHIWQPCRMWSVVCKQCLLTNAQRFFADLLHSSQQQILFQVATCNMLIIISSLLRRLRPLCWRSLFCTAAMQVFLPVSFVFALHMIKIWNHKNWNRTVNCSVFVETDRKFTNGNRHSTVYNINIELLCCYRTLCIWTPKRRVRSVHGS